MKFIDYLSDGYKKSRAVCVLQSAIEEAFTPFRDAVPATADEIFAKSTAKYIDRWEKVLDIAPSFTDSIEDRRNRILTRLRGRGTATVATIESLCRLFTNEEISVIEHFTSYSFDIKIRCPEMLFSGFTLLYDAVRAVKPSHLGFKLLVFFEVYSSKTINYQAVNHFKTRLYNANLEHKPLVLNGTRNLDGRWLLGEDILGQEGGKHALVFGVGVPQIMAQRVFIISKKGFTMDGTNKLDGNKKLNSFIERGEVV